MLHKFNKIQFFKKRIFSRNIVFSYAYCVKFYYIRTVVCFCILLFIVSCSKRFNRYDINTNNLKSLKTLAFLASNPTQPDEANGNNLLHNFVLTYHHHDHPLLECIGYSQCQKNSELLGIILGSALSNNDANDHTIRSAINALNDEGHSPLHLAVLNNSYYMVGMLLNRLHSCIDINLKSRSGYTPLHLAISRNNINVEVVKTLLENERINVNARDNYGYTPLDLARIKRNTYGQTDFNLAREIRNQICINLLKKALKK